MERFLAILTIGGDELGYRLILGPGDEKPDEAATLEPARAALAKRFAEPVVSEFNLVSSDSAKGTPGMAGTIVWRRELDELPGISARFEVHMHGDSITGERVELEVEDKALAASTPTLNPFVLGLVFFLVFLVFVVFGVYRFVIRYRENEVPVASCIAIGSLLVLLFSTAILAGGDVIENMTDGPSLLEGFERGFFFLPLVDVMRPLGLVLSAVLGLVASVLWGGVEGGLREAFPDRLTSLDAVISGRFLSRNAGRSVLTGAGFAGWVLLAGLLVDMVWAGSTLASGSVDVRFLVARLPGIGMVADAASSSLLVILAALFLLPPIVARMGRKPSRAILWWAVLIAVISAAFGPWVSVSGNLVHGLLTGAIGACALVVPFVLVDVFAALVSVFLSILWLSAWRMFWQPCLPLEHAGLLGLIVVCVLLLVSLWSFLFGKEVAASEVRPVYAMNILERLALGAELRMAREAWNRMLGSHPPDVPGVAINFSVAEDETLGGYCDIIERPDGVLALTVARIRARGSTWALVTTLLDGFLGTTSRRLFEPGRVTGSLMTRLLGDLEGARVDLGYATFDPGNRELDLGTIGDGVTVVINGSPAVFDGGTARQLFRLDRGDTLQLNIAGDDLESPAASVELVLSRSES